MSPDASGGSRIARFVRYGAVALIAAWSLTALAGYALVGALSDLVASLAPAHGWIARSGELGGQAGGLVVAILWLLGTLIVFAAMAVFGRIAT